MKLNIAEALGIHPKKIGIKATTNELLGFIGREEGIAAMAVASVDFPEPTDLPRCQKPKSVGNARRPRASTLQCYAQHVGKQWLFYRREKRFDRWQPSKTRRWKIGWRCWIRCAAG